LIITNLNTDEKSFFVHNPRTGGRYVSSRVEKSGYTVEYFRYEDKYMGIEIPHLHYPLYTQFMLSKGISQKVLREMKYWMIVRNPYERFISAVNAMSAYNDSFYDICMNVQSYSEFVGFIRSIKNYRDRGDSSNWLRSQVSFAHPNLLWWKYEDGFGDEFVQWSNTHLNLNLIEIDHDDYEITPYDFHDKSWMNDFIERWKPWIYQYYDVDFEFFGYEG